MNPAIVVAVLFAALLLVLLAVTQIGVTAIERRNPPGGTFAEIRGANIHFVHVPGPAAATLPPVVAIHGASANLRDQMLPLRPLLAGRAEMLFLDRPGHGWSERGSDNETPDGQADTIAALMRHVGIGRAIIVGHSFGGAIAAAFAVRHPDMTAGLVFLSAASHPWPDRVTSWYYGIAARPVIGRIFSHLLALPGGMATIKAAAISVFAPNPVPERYREDAGIELVLRPATFRANALDVQGLHDHVTRAAPLYTGIEAPTVVVTGNSDAIVYEEIHSLGLARDIPGAELVWIRNLGHKPDWVAPDLVAAAIEKVAGIPTDLHALAAKVERRIAGDGVEASGTKDPGEAAPL